jgi:hypothetical protein
MTDPTDTPERAAARRFKAEQEARWAHVAADHQAGGHTMIDQIRNALKADPFMPFEIHTSADLKQGIRIEDPKSVRWPGVDRNGEQDEVIVVTEKRGRFVYRIDAIQLLLID